MRNEFIETVWVKTLTNGMMKTTPINESIKKVVEDLWNEEEGVLKKELFYKYYDEYLYGYILIPVLESKYYIGKGYYYRDMVLETTIEKKKREMEEEKNKKTEEKKRKAEKKE